MIAVPSTIAFITIKDYVYLLTFDRSISSKNGRNWDEKKEMLISTTHVIVFDDLIKIKEHIHFVLMASVIGISCKTLLLYIYIYFYKNFFYKTSINTSNLLIRQ